MPGGLIQLIAYGAQNYLLNGNPSVSFFKKVYKTHTNFAMESMRVTCNKNYIHFNEKTTLIAKIKRNADLVQDVYFSVEIPDIKKVIKKDTSGNTIGDDFRFVKNFGEALLEEYQVYVGGSIIDRQYGEWLHIWNELSIDSSKRYGYDKLIGNIPELYIPDSFNRIQNNHIQINKRRIYIPLKFWFNRNPGLALPLIALQYHEIEIHLILRPLKELYTLNGNIPSSWEQHGKPYFGNTEMIQISPFLEVNYIFLDSYERNYFAVNSHDYLIEQTIRINVPNVKRNAMTDLLLQNPVKEILWVFKRNDIQNKNKWFEFTDFDYLEKINIIDEHGQKVMTSSRKDTSILLNAKLILNGMDRFEEKDATYFNLIQPYQHHTVIPKEGIYAYSFSLYPESFQPSGSCNMSRIKSVQLKTETIPLESDSLYNYDMTIYVNSYNFLRVSVGQGGLAFSW